MVLSCEQQGPAGCCIVGFCAASEEVLWIGAHAGREERLPEVHHPRPHHDVIGHHAHGTAG